MPHNNHSGRENRLIIKKGGDKMSKKFRLVTVSMLLVGLLVTVFAGTAFAANAAGADGEEQSYYGAGWGGWQEGATCSDIVGDLLGLTHEEIEAQRHEGKSMVEIAAAQGVTEDALVEAILAAKQEQSDRMFQQMELRTTEAINRTEAGPIGLQENRGAGAMRYGVSQGGRGSFDDDTELGTGTGLMRGWGRGAR